MTSRAGDWVLIHATILEPGKRAPGIPPETSSVPLEMRVKGWLVTQTAEIGDQVEIETTLGRSFRGRLEAANPPYGHDFGAAIPELLRAGEALRDMLQSGEEDRP